MTARTGTPREARTLSGCDVGREVSVAGDQWYPIIRIEHHERGVMIAVDHSDLRHYTLHRKATDLVTIRGRDE